jgi:hypothetical protein
VRNALSAAFARTALGCEFVTKGDEAGITENALAVADGVAAAFAAS